MRRLNMHPAISGIYDKASVIVGLIYASVAHVSRIIKSVRDPCALCKQFAASSAL